MAGTRTVHKDARIYVRASAEQKARLRAAAEANGETVSSFMMRCALREAPLPVEQPTVTRLSPEASRALVELLLNPPEPTADLVALCTEFGHDVESL